MYRQVNGKEFLNSIKQAMQGNKFEAFTEIKDKNYYDKSYNFLSITNDSGFSVDKQGNIVSVFNNSSIKNESLKMLQVAIKYGGKYLECFDGKLTTICQKAGFKVVDRLRFDSNYVPKVWNYKEFGTPDMVLMEHKNA